MTDLTYYEILGVDVMASDMELMEAYLSKQVDYDESGDSDALNILNHAYEVLSNPQSRQRYDAEIGVEPDTERTQPAPSAKVVMDTPPTTHHKDPFDVDPDAPTFYDLLRVEQMATSFEILETYMVLRTEYEEAGDTKAVERLQHAYTILSNQRTRDRYDAELHRLGLSESPFEPEGDEDIYDYADSAPENTANNTDDSPANTGELIFPKNKPRTSRPKRRIDGISVKKDESESDE